MLALFALFSLLGSSLAQAPVGPQINLQAVLDTGAVVYVSNSAGNHFTYTTSVANAAVFTYDATTGYLYQATTDTADFPSGFAVPAVVDQPLLGGVVELTGYDVATIQTPGYFPLSCSSTLNLGIAQVTVPLTCLNEGLTNLIVGFGVCANLANNIVNFGLVGSLTFLLGCGANSPAITTFNAVLVSLPPTPSSPTSSNALAPTSTGGVCSVTVSLIVTTTTVLVPAGYTGPLSSGSGGSTTGPNPYGCQPTTITVS